jgi:large subunit ribosomal protein L22
MQFRAVQRNARISPRKARLSADLVRGRRVEDAINILSFDKRRGSFLLRKVLEGAVANAGERSGADPMDLRVSACFVDEGLTIKRFKASARGRAWPIRRRCSHITVVVE